MHPAAPSPTINRLGRVTLVESPLGGTVVELTTPSGCAIVALKGAQVLSWTPTGQSDVLWLSPQARLDMPKAVRGGIPICWPWFGAHPDDPAHPSHGVARTALWQATASDAGDDVAAITLELASSGGAADGLHARLTVRLTTNLDIALTTTNTTQQPVTLTQALHTYFAVGDIERAHVEGLDGAAYLDQLDGLARKTQSGPVTFAAETDRIYLGSPPRLTIADGASGRAVHISGQGSTATVVWNPWAEKSARLGDLGSDGWRRMLCVETANAGPGAIQLQPGAHHTLAAQFSIT